MKMKRGQARCGFTFIDLLCALAAVFVIAYLLWPRHSGGSNAPRITCTNNLKQIGLAYRQWAIDHSDQFPMEVSVTNGGAMEAVISGNVALVFQVMSNELNTPKILLCPADQKTRRPATSFAPGFGNSNVNYFLTLDANASTPQMFLSGDDNLLIGGEARGYGVAVKGAPVKPGLLSLWTNTPVAWSEDRHKKQGNVGLADGSVLGFSSGRLAEGLRNTGVATNRLVFP